ncbi:MAG: oligosaccharide flippase family protein, partial [Nitrososphaerota archaeon]|nr:oligosaccharide flippase family protein [Nitrososphaerota archaeon]
MGDHARDTVPTVSKRMYYLFMGNVASTLILAVTAIAVGRLLGPGGYGLYTLALVMPGYVSSVGLLGLPFAATRFPAKYSAEGDRKRAVSYIHSLTFAEGLIGVVGSLALLPFVGFLAVRVFDRPSMAYLIPAALLSVLGQLLYQTATAGFQGLNRMDRSAQLQV